MSALKNFQILEHLDFQIKEAQPVISDSVKASTQKFS
jgi:hypothetical protein